MRPKFRVDKFVLSIILIYGTILFILVFFAFNAESEVITLEWEYSGSGESPDGYRIFQTIPLLDNSGDWTHVYDYINPVTTALYQDGNIPGHIFSLDIELAGIPDTTTKYVFVARAFRGTEESIDSNEVSYKIINIPPAAPIDLTVKYDAQASTINLQWQQPQDNYPISHWIIYRRISGDFIPLGTVNQGYELTLTADADSLAPDGETTVIDFVVVAYRKSGIFSNDSSTVTVELDRRKVAPVENLKIRVDIPID